MTQNVNGPAMAATIDRPDSHVDKHEFGNQGEADWQATTILSAQDHEWLTSRGVSSLAMSDANGMIF